jgi:hypothetical protein
MTNTNESSLEMTHNYEDKGAEKLKMAVWRHQYEDHVTQLTQSRDDDVTP